MKFTFQRRIQADPKTVFERATDVESWPQCISGIERVEKLTPGPVGKGTRFRETRIICKKEATEEMEFVAFDLPRGYALEANSHGCRYCSTFAFRPVDGGTELTMTFEAQPLNVVSKIMSFLMKPLAKSMCRLMERDLDDLKRAAESDTAR